MGRLGSKAIGLIVSLWAVVVPIAAWAQQPNNAIPREQSKLVLNMPGLSGQGELYQYFGWDSAYTRELYYAAQFPKGGAQYPRAQVYLTLLAPGRVWTVNRDIDAGFIQSFVPFFKNKAVKVISGGTGGSNAKERMVRFEVDSAQCVFFGSTDAFATGAGFGSSSTSQDRQPNITGIYCGHPRLMLQDADIAAVRSGVRFVPNPGKG